MHKGRRQAGGFGEHETMPLGLIAELLPLPEPWVCSLATVFWVCSLATVFVSLCLGWQIPPHGPLLTLPLTVSHGAVSH